jgi:hypothetical protein
MSLFRFVLGFLVIGGGTTGATYALFKIKNAGFGITVAIVLFSIASVLVGFQLAVSALPELPKAIDGLKEAGGKIAEWFPPPPLPAPTRYEPPKIEERTAPPAAPLPTPEPAPVNPLPPMGGPYVPPPSVDPLPPRTREPELAIAANF